MTEMRKAWIVLLASALTALTACGGGSDSASDDAVGAGGGATATTMHDHGAAAATCDPSGTTITIAALPNSRLAWDKDCLAVAAGQDFTVTFDNQDKDIPHSFAILASHESNQVFFSTGQTIGPKKGDFKVAANKLPGPGTYHFHCEVHPAQMMGTFIIK
jgi:plastocyanin